MPRDITIDFNPAIYSHNVYTGITSGTTTDIVCSNESTSCVFTVDDTFIASYDTMWVRFTCDGCKDQYHEVKLTTTDCQPCVLVGSTEYEIRCFLSELDISTTCSDLGLNNGTASASADYVIGNPTYLWSNGQTTRTIHDLSGATYSVVVTDDALTGCTISGTTTICEALPLRLSEVNSLDFRFVTTNNGFDVDFGDGNIQSYPSGIQNVQHTYSTAWDGKLRISSYDIRTGMTQMGVTANTVNSTTTSGVTMYTKDLKYLSGLTYLALDDVFMIGDVKELPRKLGQFAVGTGNLYNSNILSGITNNLPTGLTFTRIEDFNTISGDTLGLPRPPGLSYIAITGKNVISGNTSGFPQTGICPSFRTLSITGDNTITGKLSDTPRGLTYLLISGKNTITGNTNDFPRNIGVGRTDGTVSIGGNAYITGDVANLPTSTDRLLIYGIRGVTGRTENLPRDLQYCYLGSISGYTGGISGSTASFPTGCTVFQLYAEGNYISGQTSDLISGMTSLSISGGTNPISGNINSIPTGITFFALYEGNTISGNTTGLSGKTLLSTLSLSGFNTIDGSINDLPKSLKYISITGNNTITGYTSGYLWNTQLNYLQIDTNVPLVGFTDTQIDNILIDINNRVTSWDPSNSNTIQLHGISIPRRTLASQAAYSALTGSPNNVTILIT